jgi:acyl-CoA thioester hydrolase
MNRGEAFKVRISARGYEVDGNGHVAGVVLLHYGQHARWEALRAAGLEQDLLLRSGMAPVSLEESIRFHSEVRAGDELDVSCEYIWGGGKTFQVQQELRRPDGALVAEITNVGGLLDLKERKLTPNPGHNLRSAARFPQLLGL